MGTIRNELADAIIDILGPVVGDIVAKAMLEKQCKGLGITPSTIKKDHLGPLAKKIEHVLVIFGHDEQGVADKITALGRFK